MMLVTFVLVLVAAALTAVRKVQESDSPRAGQAVRVVARHTGIAMEIGSFIIKLMKIMDPLRDLERRERVSFRGVFEPDEEEDED